MEFSRQGRLQHRGHEIWWGAVDPEEPAGDPLLVVHGGPGLPSDYLEPLADLAGRRTVVFYDQYGCGRSDRADDPDDYDAELFVEELATVRGELGLAPAHLLAHSYGGVAALELVLGDDASGVRSLTLSNSFASVPALARGWERRLDELGEPARGVLLAPPRDDRYGPALEEFVDRFVFSGPVPDALTRAQRLLSGEVYARLHGSSWFEPDGQLAGWDVMDRLPSLAVPLLVIGGTQDQCVPELAEAIHQAVPRSELVVLPTRHLPFFEQRETYLSTVEGFLQRHDSSR